METANLVKRDHQNAMAAAESDRAVGSVAASLIRAVERPRDESGAIMRIEQACRRKTLAETALYSYPRGDKMVEGPSIRLAECMAQLWGNIDFGIRELSQKNGVSEVEAYCWDLETNTRQTKTFQVKHQRYSRKAGNVKLTDPRDIYEMTANMGARRLRACILGIIPGDIQELAVNTVMQTLEGSGEGKREDRIDQMSRAFFREFGVTQQAIEKFLGHALKATTEPELVKMQGVFRSLKDEMTTPAEVFDLTAPQEGESRLDAIMKQEPEKKKETRKRKTTKETPLKTERASRTVDQQEQIEMLWSSGKDIMATVDFMKERFGQDVDDIDVLSQAQAEEVIGWLKAKTGEDVE